MERLNATARLLRKRHGFRGYIHLKVIPGASGGAIEEAVSLADAVSLNIETPGQKSLEQLSSKKDYLRDIIEPMKLISRLTAYGSKYHKVKQTTQFIVGAAGESDAEIVKYVGALYDRLRIHRVYFSAYQKGLGDQTIPGERLPQANPTDIFTREHRLYQVDFLIRKYGFTESDIVFEDTGNLSLAVDPKQTWADRHPDVFPVDINRSAKEELLKVPGLGPVTVRRILTQRKSGRIRSIEDIGRPNIRLEKARKYLTF
jgi:predicted DNA-binding helix-hairpin-helix protein